ncbi:hypothetical protein ACTA71_009364 [Dictyostelium dimigraforme]
MGAFRREVRDDIVGYHSSNGVNKIGVFTDTNESGTNESGTNESGTNEIGTNELELIELEIYNNEIELFKSSQPITKTINNNNNNNKTNNKSFAPYSLFQDHQGTESINQTTNN